MVSDCVRTMFSVFSGEGRPNGKGDLLDFADAVARNGSLGLEALAEFRKSDPQELSAWFRRKGFLFSILECAELIKISNGYQVKK